MVDELISLGNKIDLRQIENRMPGDDTEPDIRVYKSQVLDIDEKAGILQAAMPIFEGHLIPLEIGTTYDAFFQTSKGLYRTICQVVGRSKEEKIYIVQLKLISELVKFQRREYFRLDTNIEVTSCQLTDNELKTFMFHKIIPEKFDNTMVNGIIIDISGGGARVLSKAVYTKNSIIVLEFDLMNDFALNHIAILGKVIACEKNQNKPELNEIRIQFKWIPKTVREVIVKNILEEQRRLRQKERGWQ